MKKLVRRSLLLATLSTVIASAGALYLQVANPDTNAEARSLHATLVARANACHDPAKSTVTASSIRWVNGHAQRTPLKVAPLTTPGLFAVIGTVPPGSVIDLAVSNPEYQNYQPRVLLSTGDQGVQWASAKHFFGTPPTDDDVRSLLSATAVN